MRGRVLTRESVLVPWGCLNKVPTDWVASNNRSLFFHRSGGWKSDITGPRSL